MALDPAPQLGTTRPLMTSAVASAPLVSQIGTPEGAALVQEEGSRPTYLFAINGTLQATPTDVLEIAGPAAGRLRVNKLRVSGLAATASQQIAVSLIRRSTLHAGGSVTAVTPIAADIPNDGTFGAKGAVNLITTNGTTLGTIIAAVKNVIVPFNLATAAVAPAAQPIYEPGRGSKPIVLEGTLDNLVLNLGSVTLANSTIIYIDGELTYEADE